MLGMLATSLLFVLLGLLGLLIAAGSDGGSSQYMGIGLIVFSWLFLMAYHGHRAERLAQDAEQH